MFGPDKLATSAKRLSRNRWRVFNVVNSRSWWGYGRRRYNVPRIGRHLRWLTSYGCYGCSYNYLRETWIAATTAHLEWDAIGPDCFVIAYDHLVDPINDLNTGVRRVLYLTTLPDDGLELPPDSTCVPAGVPAPPGTRIQMNPPDDKRWRIAEGNRLAYGEFLTARDEGRTIYTDGKWLSPQEHERQIEENDARSRWLRLATGR